MKRERRNKLRSVMEIRERESRYTHTHAREKIGFVGEDTDTNVMSSLMYIVLPKSISLHRYFNFLF